MYAAPETPLVEQFRELLGQNGANENAIQTFLEQNITLMLTPGLLNHGLHQNCLISKFPIGERIADFAYLTKSSDEWKLILVELEDPGKKLFVSSSKHHSFSAQMNDAIAQIDVWREYWTANRRAVVETIEPILVPPNMRRNSISLECVLIIGRSAEKDHDEAKRSRLAALRADKRIQVMTYDTLIRAVAEEPQKPRAILTKTGFGFRLRSVEGFPKDLFGRVYSEHLTVDPEPEKALRDAGYDIDAWLANELLTVDGKLPLAGAWKRAEEAGFNSFRVNVLKAAEKRRRTGNDGPRS